MEGREGVNLSAVTVVASDATPDYHVAPRSETSAPTGGSTSIHSVTPTMALATPTATALTIPTKKKRGRPRKYGPDGAVTKAFSPKPISSSAPSPVIDFSAGKRGKVKPASSVSKTRHEFENLGEWVACSVGANFTPHLITVNVGEDVTMKVISFSQQGPRAICVLSANGVISSVTLRQPDSSGGTLTYEGRFEILSLSGSFMPNESGGTRSRAGGMSVSLASPDGRVMGGGVAGLLIAASPVQVVVGSFLTGNQHEHEHKVKKHKHEYMSLATITAAVPITSADPHASFRGDNWSSLPTDSNNKSAEINLSFTGV